MDVRYLVLTLFLLASCMPTAQVSKGNLANSETTSGSSTGGTTSSVPFSWNYLGEAVSTITINVSNLNNAYIIGAPVEAYLSDTSTNFTNMNYCFVSSYSVGGVAYELRSRVIPISYYDFAARRTVRNLRVDFQDVANSTANCGQTKRVKNSSGTYVVDASVGIIKYDPNTLCPLCTSMLSAVRVKLFKVNGTFMDEVPSTLINVPSLSLQVDPNYDTTGNAGSCSNSDCQARGYDCCLENQCVRDGATKSNASTLYSSLLQTAEQERLQNPMAYLNYPQLYYICGSSVPTTAGSTSGTTSGSTGGTTSGSTGGTTGSTGGYDAAFALLKRDYSCIQNLKNQSTVTPFHNEVLTRSYTAAADCLTGASDAGAEMYYQNVMKRLYTTCGCNRTELTDMVANCPAYDYTVVSKDTNNVPTQIDCYTPPTSTLPVPLNRSVSVSSRSAPHRFFDMDGAEKELALGTQQEGDAFSYLDEGKVLPVQQNFSMNSILGQMSVTLDQALPAKSMAVELDQIYFLSTTSGYYTPCPTCAKDSWLNSFTAYPSASTGTGLQATGHTTERDVFSNNTTGGNYEDTIFGRACWVPPTMLPYSHSPYSSTVDQRRNRLKAQAALFANGYQRDWFGFNKGALIGSFDGVSWFAVGKGRIVRSTSKKLFLAINAPFADLATPTLHVVRVQAYDGITQAAQVDYDPQYHQYHAYQNEAGNCQKYHMCETDTECVTKLGWEYSCADVRDLKTNWPEFDSEGNEKANTSVSVGIDQILQQKRYPSSSTKRCVYRGSGSICHTNSGALPGTDLNRRKLLTCAPNFYCASTSSAGVHNNKVARYAAPLADIPVSRNHFFGKDANVLGRPLDYMGSGTLPSEVRATLADNVDAFEATLSTQTGLCQPGKNLPTTTNHTSLSNPFNQHMSADASRRSDFINQIASCNPTLFNYNRHTSCPVIGADGNFEIFSQPTFSPTYFTRASAQNACGLESLLQTASLGASADTLQSSSPFRNIEAKPLNSQIILEPTMVRDACLRRAGAVCHTDLDCSPNKFHAAQTDLFATTYFGNAAEKSYWSEYLVCGQTDPKPLASQTEAFKNYDMSKNLCCREIGKDLTTFTSDLPTDTFVSLTRPYDAVSAGLKMSLAPGTGSITNDPKRYSRLATVEGVGVTKPILSANIDRSGGVLTGATNISTPKQWQTLTEANSESCCGGGWIRKFSDGGNDWTRRDRVVLDVTNFRCINSRTPLLTDPSVPGITSYYNNAADVQALVTQDYGDYCKDSTGLNGACAMSPIVDSANDVLPDPTGMSFSSITVNTISPDYTLAGGNGDNYFMPRSSDGNSAVIIDYADTSITARRNISIKLPSFVTRDFDVRYASATNGNPMSPSTHNIKVVSDTGSIHDCVKYTTYAPSSSTDASTPVGGNACVYSYNPSSRILKIGLTSGLATSGSFDQRKVGIRFDAVTPGNGTIGRTKPGTNAYYSKRLGRLELSGIPQIAYEILTCNDNSDRVVPGIFDINVKTRAQFNDNSFSFLQEYSAKTATGTAYNTTQRFTNMHGLQNEPVFSPNDFKCCSPLGKTVTDSSKCCSGFGVTFSGNQKTCALPAGANLMVYFNRFVSNEGRGTDQPGGGLLDTDFQELTGEPVLTASVNDKIRALGVAYCSTGKVRQGGAFGSFTIEPSGADTDQSALMYNIVDSTRDSGQVSNAGTTVRTGYSAFSNGYRWNHHLYCDD